MWRRPEILCQTRLMDLWIMILIWSRCFPSIRYESIISRKLKPGCGCGQSKIIFRGVVNGRSGKLCWYRTMGRNVYPASYRFDLRRVSFQSPAHRIPWRCVYSNQALWWGRHVVIWLWCELMLCNMLRLGWDYFDNICAVWRGRCSGADGWKCESIAKCLA